MVTICHVTPSGQQITLNLPEAAAQAHLAQHPRDYMGACQVQTEPEPVPAPEVSTGQDEQEIY